MKADELTSGEDVKVDSASIEQTLAELWRTEKRDDVPQRRARDRVLRSIGTPHVGERALDRRVIDAHFFARCGALENVFGHGRLHLRPSRSINSSASGGPQIPAE